MLTSRLAFGPMSREVIEAVFKYSEDHKKQLMLICSRNQIDYNQGYVFMTDDYAEFIYVMKSRYKNSDVKICRDHCGPGFGSRRNTMDSVKRTIFNDISNGFDLIHLDLCHMEVDYDTKIERTIELIEFAKSIEPDMLFEIGTDENVGVAETDTEKLSKTLDRFLEHCDPAFYVVQTGSLVKGMGNIGRFDKDAVSKTAQLLKSKNIRLKEHNADYLNKRQIMERRGIVDAINIAPQLGVIQTQCIMLLASIYGVDTSEFSRLVVNSGNWCKWIVEDDYPNAFAITMLGGHYHYQSNEYREIIRSLQGYTDVEKCIIDTIYKVIRHYAISFGEHCDDYR